MIIHIDGHTQSAGINRQPIFARQKLPGPVDRITFEIIAKTKVTQHLKKGVVIGSAPYIVDIAGPETFLASGCTGEVQLHLPEEMRFELIHPRGREQYRWIPSGNENIALASRMSLAFEEL